MRVGGRIAGPDSAGGSRLNADADRAVRQRVRAVVTLALVRSRVTPTRSLRVGVSPDHAGERVLTEKRTKQGWKVIARLRLGRSSASRGPVPGRLGSPPVAVRAVFEGDVRNVLSVSRVLTIRP